MFDNTSRDMYWKFSVPKGLASRLHNRILIYDSSQKAAIKNPLKRNCHRRTSSDCRCERL